MDSVARSTASWGDPRLPQAFWDRVVPEPNARCWLWIAGGKPNSYGIGWYAPEQRHVQTHRLAYRVLVGEIDVDLEIDHLCRVEPCCNPAHLEPVTHSVNMLRAVAAGFRPRVPAGVHRPVIVRTHCKAGHELTADNVYVHMRNGRQDKHCLTCQRAANKRFRAAQKEAR